MLVVLWLLQATTIWRGCVAFALLPRIFAFAFLNVFVLGVMPCLAGPLRAAMPCLAGPLGAAGHAVCLAYRSDS